MSVHDAIREMWERMRPLEQRGYNPVSEVEIVDATSKKIIQTYQLTDPEFQLHLQSEEKGQNESQKPTGWDPHVPEKKEHYRYLARIQLK